MIVNRVNPAGGLRRSRNSSLVANNPTSGPPTITVKAPAPTRSSGTKGIVLPSHQKIVNPVAGDVIDPDLVACGLSFHIAGDSQEGGLTLGSVDGPADLTFTKDEVDFPRTASTQRAGAHEGHSQICVTVPIHISGAGHRKTQVALAHTPVNPNQFIPARIKGADVHNPLSLGTKKGGLQKEGENNKENLCRSSARKCHVLCQLLVHPGPSRRNQPGHTLPVFSHRVLGAGTTIGGNRPPQIRERSTLLRNTILVVDDEELGRLSIQEALLADGHKVITSASGSHARGLLASQEEDIKLVILDWIMPDVEGIEVLKWIRRQRELESVEVIMLSARIDPADVKKGVGAGAYHYLTKPFQVSELQALVRAALRNSRMKESLAKEIARSEKAFRLLENATFVLRTADQAECLGAGLASACAADKCGGLLELFVNAIEHGNLGIGYEEKTRLLGEGILSEEIERRLELPENADKKGYGRDREIGRSRCRHGGRPGARLRIRKVSWLRRRPLPARPRPGYLAGGNHV